MARPDGSWVMGVLVPLFDQRDGWRDGGRSRGPHVIVDVECYERSGLALLLFFGPFFVSL